MARVPDFVDEVIVVSNRSIDNTVTVAEALADVIVIEDDRVANGTGYGYAHMTGMEKATSDLVVAADGDDTYPVADLDQVLDHLLDYNLDFVSCARYPVRHGTNIPPKLRLGTNLLNWETRFFYGY